MRLRDETLYVPIIPIITGTGLCLDLKRELEKHGFLVHALQYPVVPRDGERIRLMMHVTNTADEIYALVDALMKWAIGNPKAVVTAKL